MLHGYILFGLYITFLFQSSKIESARDSPATPPLSKERAPRHFHHPTGMGYSSSDSLDRHQIQPHPCYETSGLTSTPNLSNISAPKTERSSLDASVRTSSSGEDHSGEFSISNASDMETEWVEQDEPGVYITIRALPGGTRELRRVRFRYKEVINVDNKLLLVLMQQLFNSVTNYLNKLYCMKTCSCSLIWHFSRINHPYTNNVKIFYIVIQSHIIVYVKSDIGEDDFWFVDNVNFFIVVVPSY